MKLTSLIAELVAQDWRRTRADLLEIYCVGAEGTVLGCVLIVAIVVAILVAELIG